MCDGNRGKALIAMSGGVDSSVAALLTQKAGYHCIGVTMRLTAQDNLDAAGGRSCCALSDVEDARSVACRLGIPHYVFNFTREFQRWVVDRFAAGYACGETPNPCVDCNRFIKFDLLLRRAQMLGCRCVVTGHYARIQYQAGRYLLKKAVDAGKDQSYFLYAMTQEQLAQTRFPLGGREKTEIRSIAAEHGFLNAEKRDSQDICFVPGGDYAAFLLERMDTGGTPGDFVDRNGTVLGTHRGIVHYTIGQRKGLGLSLPQPMYVCEKRPLRNQVVLGPRSALEKREVLAADFNWISFADPPERLRVTARVRYRQPDQWAAVSTQSDGKVRIVFDQPVSAPACGQAVVLYDGDTVVGGGTICAVG